MQKIQSAEEPGSKRRRRLSEREVALAAQRYQDDLLPLRALAHEYGVAYGTMHKALKEHLGELRPRGWVRPIVQQKGGR